ncbi:hypothetical protein [uncultured Dialister sp.]|uniref:hypothetical protein n=1 Tax=uncultured Dialister sp. TaxID=278064 RepID=UPI0025D858C7|nr:hypothetical protein [uncultured Dialister sp.]
MMKTESVTVIVYNRRNGKICFFLLLTGCLAADAAGPINRDGYFKNIRLAGRVRVVDSFPDIKVQVVSSFPDLKVKAVSSFPDDIGEWQFVDYGEDFTVQFVDSFPDIRIEFVDSFPGVC